MSPLPPETAFSRAGDTDARLPAAVLDEFERRQLEPVVQHMATASVVATAFALALAVFYAPVLGAAITQGWFAVKLAVALPRAWFGFRHARHPKAVDLQWTRRFVLLSLALDGFVWGCAGAYCANLTSETALFLLASLTTVAAIATLGFQTSLAAACAFVLPIIIPSGIAFGFRADAVGVFGVSASILTVLQTLIASRNAETRLLGEVVARHRLQQAMAERAQLAEERARVGAMQEVLTARSAFLAKVSHELRSPIQGIVSALDVLEMRRDQAIGQSDELVHRIRRSSLLLNTQLRDLLTLAKGEAGQLAVHPEVFEFNELVEAISASTAELALAKGLAVRTELPEEPAFVVADGPRIDQILTNVVVNAIRYTPDGEVCITARPYAPSERLLRLEVRDTGPGMPPEAVAMLRSRAAGPMMAASPGDGSGLGLAIVRTLIELLGGRISVEQNSLGGSVVAIEIPAEPAEPLSGAAPGDTHRLLIVDDVEDVREALASVADELGFECDQASSAAVAANLLAARRYDAVLLDLEMRGKGGIEIATEARRREGPNRGARFIGMSASDASEEARSAFDAWLGKPIRRSSLRQALGMTDTGFRPSQPGLWAEEAA